MKNDKKRNEELVARVKDMIDEDADILFEKMVSVLKHFMGKYIHNTA